MTNTTEEKKPLDKLENETVQKIDYIIRGLELGKYDETAKKVEFLGKLTGDESPRYIAKLLDRIADLEFKNSTMAIDIINLDSKIIQLESDKIDQNTRLINIENDMRFIATGIRQLFEPAPLKKNYDLSGVDQFCNKHGATSY